MKRFIVFVSVLFAALIYYANLPTTLPQNDSGWQKFLRHISYSYIKLKNDSFCNAEIPFSNVPIDIVIPVIEKDAETLIHTLYSLRANVMQPIGKIYLVAPKSEMLEKMAADNNCEFVLEDKVLPKFSSSTNRKGWIKQQYLKLNADTIVENEHYLVIDADTILIRPQIFVKPGKEVLNILGDYWFKRKVMVKQALGFKKFHNLDFTSHHMLFSKTKLKALKKSLENIHGKAWNDALDSLEIPEGSFSEYELYANFVVQKFPHEIELVWGRNALFPRNGLANIVNAREYLCTRYKSLTMHSFLNITDMKN